MNRFASIAAAVAALALVPAAPALAQAVTPAQSGTGPSAGATVYDAQGAEVGQIESIADGNAVIFTGTSRATVPLTSFGTSPKGPTFGMTRAELDAAAAKAAATAADQLRPLLKPGTQVRGKSGAVVATVKSLDGDNVVLSTGGKEARVPISGFAVNAQGVFIGMTQAEFDAAVAAGAPSGS